MIKEFVIDNDHYNPAIKNDNMTNCIPSKKIRPDAYISFNDYNHDFYIRYRCPDCGTPFGKGKEFCEKCGVYFDWSLSARIKTTRKVVWG